MRKLTLVIALIVAPHNTLAGDRLAMLSDYEKDHLTLEALRNPQPFPSRSSVALSGSEFLKKIEGLSIAAREEAILNQIRLGNVPGYLRKFETIAIPFTDRDGASRTLEVRVSRDYLSVGSNDDFVRVPMKPTTAQIIADELGLMLPTRKLVNMIYAKAETKLQPQPLPPTKDMHSTGYFDLHHKMIQTQLNYNVPTGIVVGHKKDIVLTNRLNRFPDRVAIYGWHRQNAKPIQPLSLVHGKNYVDYSHGVRVLHHTALLDGVEIKLVDVLAHPFLAKLISDEGQLTASSYPAR